MPHKFYISSDEWKTKQEVVCLTDAEMKFDNDCPHKIIQNNKTQHMEKMTQAEYATKKQEVLNKFKEDFVKENLHTDATFNMVLESLIRDADPFEIIQRLIDSRKELLKHVEQYTLMHGKPLSPLGFLAGFEIKIVKNPTVQKGTAILMLHPDTITTAL